MTPQLDGRADDHTTTIGLAAIAALVAMISISLATGVSQEQFELVRDPVAYAADLRAHPAAVRAVFAVDTAFLVLYSAFFLQLGRRLATDATRTLITVATGALLFTALLDMVEDHHILALLGTTTVDAPPDAGSLDVGSLCFNTR